MLLDFNISIPSSILLDANFSDTCLAHVWDCLLTSDISIYPNSLEYFENTWPLLTDDNCLSSPDNNRLHLKWVATRISSFISVLPTIAASSRIMRDLGDIDILWLYNLNRNPLIVSVFSKPWLDNSILALCVGARAITGMLICFDISLRTPSVWDLPVPALPCSIFNPDLDDNILYRASLWWELNVLLSL